MVSPLLLPTFGTLSLLVYFQFPSTFLPSKGRSITTLGTRWDDIFLLLFFIFYKFVLFFSLLFFSFSWGCRLEKGRIVPVLCSQSFKKKKKKKMIYFHCFSSHLKSTGNQQTQRPTLIFIHFIARRLSLTLLLIL